MKNYLIETTANGYFVHVGDEPFGGPYKNEESAKRRIRDLKAKEISAGVHDKLITPTPPVVVTDEMRKPSPTPRSAEKLAASSAYGKSNVDPGWINPPFNPIINDRRYVVLPIVRQVGCYPAISKHAYQR